MKQGAWATGWCTSMRAHACTASCNPARGAVDLPHMCQLLCVVQSGGKSGSFSNKAPGAGPCAIQNLSSSPAQLLLNSVPSCLTVATVALPHRCNVGPASHKGRKLPATPHQGRPISTPNLQPCSTVAVPLLSKAGFKLGALLPQQPPPPASSPGEQLPAGLRVHVHGCWTSARAVPTTTPHGTRRLRRASR